MKVLLAAVQTAGVWCVIALQQLLRPLPMAWVWRLGALAGTLCSWLLPRYRDLVENNLKRAFGDEISPVERRAIRREHFRQLGGNLFASFQIPCLDPARVRHHIEVVGFERLEAACADGRGVVTSLAHQSAWELLAQVPNLNPSKLPAGAIYQQLRNPKLDRLVRTQREARGTVLFSRSAGFRGPLQHLRAGGIVGILADQHSGDAGTWLPFFGRLASATTLPALLARRSGARLMNVEVRTLGPARWRISFGKAIDPRDDPRDGVELTRELMARLESSIRHQPADWFWVHQRWKTPTPTFLWSGLDNPPSVATADEAAPFRLLVRSPNWLGDACMALPMVRALKAGRPRLELSILCRRNLAPFWERMDGVDHVIAVERSDSPARVGRVLREHGPFDTGILCPNSTRSALEMHFGRVTPVIGTAGQFLRRRIVDQTPLDQPPGSPRHHLESYLDLARLVGADCSKPEFFQPARPAPGSANGRRIGIVAGAEYGPAKRWPAERFARTIELLLEEDPQREFHLFGTPSETTIGVELLGALEHDSSRERIVDRIGQTRLDQLMDELAGCDLLISNDTGGMHLAAALGVPVVAVFGSTEPAWTRPIGRRHRIVRRHVSCSPCFLRNCPLDFRCMREITPKLVVDQSSAIFREEQDQGDSRK